MHFLIIQLFLILFYQKVFAVNYDTPCATTCNFPGMICVSGKCKCDMKNRLFWTGARCLLCPNGWSMSEIKCIGYYGTKMTWQNALATCQQIQGDLISLRDNSILPLVYEVTGNINGRKKRGGTAADKTVGWTSAHAIQLNNLGLYGWNDNSLSKFDSTHEWWCRLGIKDMGYYYPYKEPTRLVHNHNEEKCVLFRRGQSTSQMLCLDDTLCDEEYPFICERSESTAQKFIGSPSTNEGHKPDTSGGGSATNTNSNASGAGSHIQDTNSNTNNGHHSAALSDPSALKSNKKSKLIIILIVIGLLLLAGVLIGVFFFIRHRNAGQTQFPVGGNNFKENQTPYNARRSVKNDPIGTDIKDVAEIPPQHITAEETGLTLDAGLSPKNMDINIGNQKQQKNRRGGFSKQQFDEFQ